MYNGCFITSKIRNKGMKYLNSERVKLMNNNHYRNGVQHTCAMTHTHEPSITIQRGFS